jgi:predicted ribosomally synthesized peptide with nif11-like leader
MTPALGGLIYPELWSIFKGILRKETSMRSAELNRLLEDVRKDPHLLEASRALLRDPDGAIRWAGDRGYHLTREDVQELLESDRELSDDDLEQAAGGAWPPS